MDGWYDGKIIKCYWSNEELQFVYKVKYEGRAKTEAMTEIQLAEIIKNEEDESLYTYEEFNALWEKLDPETIEKSAAIRRANGCFEIKETGTKYNAQYGRMLPGSTDMIFQLMQLHRDDIFLDIGAGIGNSCLQAAYTRGCEARGIEVIENRYEMGLQFKENLEALAHKRDMLDGKVCLTCVAWHKAVFVDSYFLTLSEPLIPRRKYCI